MENRKEEKINNKRNAAVDQQNDYKRSQAEEKEFSRYFDKKSVKMIYALLFGCNFFINIDHGTIPASTLNLKSDLGLDNVALGFIGSIVFLGLTFGMFILIDIVQDL